MLRVAAYLKEYPVHTLVQPHNFLEQLIHLALADGLIKLIWQLDSRVTSSDPVSQLFFKATFKVAIEIF